VKGSSATAQILKQEGADVFFCFPINPLIDAVAELGIRPIVARTERTVVGMADGYSRVNNARKIGICATQFGPGVENAFGGVAQAFSDSTPILYLPAGPVQSRVDSLPTFEAAKNYQYVTKWAARVNQVGRIPEFFRRAFTYLRNGRPGPVLLEMPMDVLGAEIDEAAAAYQAVKGAKTMASPGDVTAAVQALVAAKNPIIHAGVGVLYAEAWDELRELAELLQAPAMTTLQGKSAFPEDHPLSLGAATSAGSKALFRYLAESDLIFGVGSGLAISSYDAPIPGGKTAIQLTVDERDINRDYVVQFPLMGDAKLVLRQMIEEVQRQVGPEGRKGDDRVAGTIKALKDEWLAEWMPKLTSDETPINPYRVVWELQQAVDLRNVIVTHDAGTPRDMMVPFWPALEPNSYVGWGKSTHLGYGIPLALGAKVARPEKTVINVMGDLAFGMSGLEIETAARNKLGTITVVMNNGLMGDYEKHIGLSTRLYGTRFITGNYSKVGEGLGAHSVRVESPGDLGRAFREAVEVSGQNRPVLVEVMSREETKLSKY